MPRLSKKAKQEWDFFIHPNTKRRTYNELCRKCINNCKQSYRARVVECRKYVSKRSKNKAKKDAPNPHKNDEVYSLKKRYYPP